MSPTSSPPVESSSAPVLVTGANGFLGAAVVRALAAAGHAVRRGVRRMPAGVPPSAAWTSYGDIASERQWGSVLEGIATVVHLAGLAHLPDDRADTAASSFESINTEATARLAAAAAAAGVRRFIQMSSALVYGSSSWRPLVEDDPARPETPYARSKLAADQRVQEAARDTAMDWVILRPPLVYGPGGKGNFQRLVRLVSSGWPLPFGCATAPKTFLALDNLSSAVARCICDPRAANRIFLIGDGEATSTAGLIELIAGALGRPARNIPVPAALMRAGSGLAGRRRDFARLFHPLEIHSGRIRELLGWRPPVSLADGVRRAVRGIDRP
jgi:nucleoside-diphosphate-sugar epimerase